MAEIVFEFVAVIFHRVEAFVLDLPARLPQAMISATFRLVTGRLVIHAMEYLTRSLAPTISKPIQLTSMASLPPCAARRRTSG